MLSVFVVFGSNGMLGRYCCEHLRDRNIMCIALDRTDCDADKATPATLRALFQRHLRTADGKPKYPEHCVCVLNAAGLIRQRPAISLATLTRVNGVFPHQLQQMASEFDFRLIHISTDCVFDGCRPPPRDRISTSVPGGPASASASAWLAAVVAGYVEGDECTESNAGYAVSKRLAELLLAGSTACVIRTSIIGEEERNGLSLLQWLISRRGQTVPGFDNHFWNGVTCLQLAKTIVAAAVTGQLWTGVRHIFSPAGLSKCGLLQEINRVYGLGCTIVPTRHEVPSNKCLSTSSADTAPLLSRIPPIQQQLAELFLHRRRLTPLPSLTRTTCRFCTGSDLVQFLDLGSMPHAGGFLTSLTQTELSYPLRVHFCRGCALVQVLDVIPKEVLFTDYFYTSSVSRTLQLHAETCADAISGLVATSDAPLVVEVGSNDGVLLRPLRARNIRAIGVEAAANVAQLATDAGLSVMVGFFTELLAGEIVRKHGQADVVTGSNVFAHIDDMDQVARAVKKLLKPSGTWVIEVHHLLNLITEFQYDMIYNEHLCYHSIHSLGRFLAKHGFLLHDAQQIPIHAGSIRVFASPDPSHNNMAATQTTPEAPAPVCDPARASTDAKATPVCTVLRRSARLLELLARESAAGLEDERTFASYAQRVASHKRELTTLLRRLRAEGKRVVGYGASGRANTVLNFCGIGPDLVDCIADDSARRQNTFTPGMHIPVVLPAQLRLSQPTPDYVLLLAWSYADEITAKLRPWFKGQFIVPLPSISIS